MSRINAIFNSSEILDERLKMQEWIWQAEKWTNFTWLDSIILPKTRQIHQKIGILLGQSQHDLAKEQFTLDRKVVGVIHAIRSILSYRNLSHKKSPTSCRAFSYRGARLTDLVLPIPCAIFLFLFSGNIQFPYVFIIGLMLWITNPQSLKSM